MLQQLDTWHKTRIGYAVFGALELLLAYTVGSFAINSGSLWQWGLAIVIAFGAIQNLIRTIFYKQHGQ